LRFAAYRSRPETTHSQVAHRFNTNNLARAVPEIGVETPKNLHELRRDALGGSRFDGRKGARRYNLVAQEATSEAQK